jgi:hypothetical protein
MYTFIRTLQQSVALGTYTMKKLLALSLLVCLTGHAQEIIQLQKPLKCSNADFVIPHFAKEFGETPVWVGKSNTNSHLALLVNKEKKTWTVVEYTDTTACVLGSGNAGSNPNNI